MNRLTRTAVTTLKQQQQQLLLLRPTLLLSPYSTSSPSPPPAPSSSSSRPTPTPQPTNLPGSNLPKVDPRTKYSPWTISLVTRMAKLFGYHSQTSTAIRVCSDYYDRCAERGEIEAPFFYEGTLLISFYYFPSLALLLIPSHLPPPSSDLHPFKKNPKLIAFTHLIKLRTECALPPSFQTWFSITTLHIWLLSVRFRSLPSPLGRTYVQELINHFFIDIELRIRGPYNVTQGKLIKGYMKDMLEQYHGSIAAYDEALICALPSANWSGGEVKKGDQDAALAAAIWRNVFGAGWGGKVGGVKGKRAPKSGEAPALGPNPNPEGLATTLKVDKIQSSLLKKGKISPSTLFKTDEPLIDPQSKAGQKKFEPLYPDYPDLQFVESLEKLVKWCRVELVRLERLPEGTVVQARPEKGPGSLVDFHKI